MKVRLVKTDLEEREKGREFMNRVKERRDMEFPAYVNEGAHRIHDNASRFKKGEGISNLVMVKKRGEGTCGEGELNLCRVEENYDENEGESVIGVNVQSIDEIEEMMNGIEESQKEDKKQIRGEDKDLEYKFLAEFEKLEHCNFTEIEELDKLSKSKMQHQLIERANRVLGKYLKEKSDIPGMIDIVFAKGKAVASTFGIRAKERFSNNQRMETEKRERLNSKRKN